MGRKSKQKGARGELEVAKLLQTVVEEVSARRGVLPVHVQRSTYMQANKGGDDLVGIPWASIEVKRHEKICASLFRKWWAQTCGQKKFTQCPILIWRQSHQPWRARVRTAEYRCDEQWYYVDVDMSWEHFTAWFARVHELWIEQQKVDSAP